MKRKEIKLRVTISYIETDEVQVLSSDPVWLPEDAISGKYNYCVESAGFIDN